MGKISFFRDHGVVREEILNGKHDKLMREIIDKIHSYLLANQEYNLDFFNDVEMLCNDFRGLVASMIIVYVMEHFPETNSIKISDSTKEPLMTKAGNFYDKLKEKGLDDEYLNLVQWIILRPFSFKRFLKASWDNQPILFVDGKRKSK